MMLDELSRLLEDMEQQLAGFVRSNWTPKDAAEAAHAPNTSGVLSGGMHMGDNNFNITGSSNVGVAVGTGATGTGSVALAAAAQEVHRQTIAAAESALGHDRDVLNKLDSDIYQALSQFLRTAKDIQVENRATAELQSQMKATMDDIWAHSAAKGLRTAKLPNTLEVVKVLASSPIMTEVVKKLMEP